MISKVFTMFLILIPFTFACVFHGAWTALILALTILFFTLFSMELERWVKVEYYKVLLIEIIGFGLMSFLPKYIQVLLFIGCLVFIVVSVFLDKFQNGKRRIAAFFSAPVSLVRLFISVITTLRDANSVSPQPFIMIIKERFAGIFIKSRFRKPILRHDTFFYGKIFPILGGYCIMW